MSTIKVLFARRILENVSFDPKLFSKELRKVVATLLPYEIEVLTQWLISFVKEKPELHQSLYLVEIE